MVLSQVVYVPVVLQRWRALPRLYTSCMGTSRVRPLPAGTGSMALKPSFSSLYYSYEMPRPEASTPLPRPLIALLPPRSLHPAGIGGWPFLSMGASYGAASSTIVPTRGYREVAPIGCKYPLVRTQSTPEVGQRPRLVNARGWSTPEA